MKVLSARQFDEIKHKFLGFEGEWLRFMGNMPETFIGLIFGESGEGKSEFCIRMAKYLIQFEKVAWIDYEQGHGADLQMAMRRNEMNKEVGKWFPIDPNEKRKRGVTFLEELDEYLSKRSTPKYVFINSLTEFVFTPDEFRDVLKPHAKKRGLIFIDHAKNRKPKSKHGEYVEGIGQFSIYVRKYIAYKEKNRLGGRGEMILWEEEAKRLNPLYFKRLEAENG
jgi:hypothetical protein